MNEERLQVLIERYLENGLSSQEAKELADAFDASEHVRNRMFYEVTMSCLISSFYTPMKCGICDKVMAAIRDKKEKEAMVRKVVEGLPPRGRKSILHTGHRRSMRREKTGSYFWRILQVVAACIAVVVGVHFFNFWQKKRAPVGIKAKLAEAECSVYIRRGDKTIPAKAGMDILLNDTIQTGGEGKARVKYEGEYTTIDLYGVTEVKFWEDHGAKRIDVLIGTIECDVERQQAGKTMILNTPHAEAEVFNTRFTLSVFSGGEFGNGMTRLEVQKGKVRLTRKCDGKSVFVMSRQYGIVGSGIELTVEPITSGAKPSSKAILFSDDTCTLNILSLIHI